MNFDLRGSFYVPLGSMLICVTWIAFSAVLNGPRNQTNTEKQPVQSTKKNARLCPEG